MAQTHHSFNRGDLLNVAVAVSTRDMQRRRQMAKLIRPHGGGLLRPLLVPGKERADEVKRAERLVKVPLSSREVSDIFMLAMGAYTPLDGFMREEDWRTCCTDMTTSTGLFWPIP